MREYDFKTYEHYFSRNMKSDAPFAFSSIEEAKKIFEYGRYLFLDSHGTQSPHDAVDSSGSMHGHIAYCAELLTKFSHDLHVYAKTKGSLLTPQEDVAVAALQLHVLNTFVSFYVEHLPPAYRPHKNELLSQMREMVLLGEKIISSISNNQSFEDQTTSFCLDMGWIIPLYTVASQCQDATIRRGAIDLIRSTPRQEGLWNNLVIAKAAERIMEIEENDGMQLRACTDDVMSSTSSKSPTILQLDARGVRLQYVRPGHASDTYVNVVEEVLSW